MGTLRVLRLRRSGNRYPKNPALERDAASDSGLDRKAASDDCRGLSGAPICNPRSRCESLGRRRSNPRGDESAVLKTPARVPQANTFCERLIGTIRHECLDFVIPMTERHFRAILREWI